jgi:hypothetical protein
MDPNQVAQLSRKEMITEIMSYHAPTPEKLVKFAAVREKAIALVEAIDEHCPPSADRTAAVRQVQDALMTANRSIANDGAGYR